MTRRPWLSIPLAITLMLSALARPTEAQDEFASDAVRLSKALKLTAGQTVADIGAGEGHLSVALSRIVGASGRVYATDVSADRLRDIKRAAVAAQVHNIVVTEGHAARTNLPDACCDAAVVRFVYHHFRDPRSMNASLLRTLKPGALLAVIDFSPDSGESSDPAGRVSDPHHGVTASTVERELREAGFEAVAMEDATEKGGYLVVMRRPRR
jgi:ubiquinone/menaquinone biosynthesis C-methylase UbiE